MTLVAQMSEHEFFAWHWSMLELDRTCRRGHLMALYARKQVVKGVEYERCAKCQNENQRAIRAMRKAAN